MDAADLAFAGLDRQAELIRSGEASPRELTELYLERIARLDPQVRAYRVVLPDEALAAADAADRRRAAGAVILGKTHVPELEALATTESLAYGATHNPWASGRRARSPAACSTRRASSTPRPAAAPSTPTRRAGPRAGCGSRCRPRSRAGSSPASTTSRAPRSTAPPSGCASSGHTVVERDPDDGSAGVNVVTRDLRGVADDAAARPHTGRLARWTRGIAALGARIPERIVRRARAQETADRERTSRVLAECDVLLTPVLTRRPPLLGEWLGLPAPLAVNGMAAFAAHLAIWNHTGQPAASVPVETTPDGFPVAVQLVGRAGDEATLLSFAAQLETATGWLDRRPPIAA